MSENRYRTYIKGFDEHLEGGIPREHIVLIAGTAGTMKSSIAYNILCNNAKDNGIKGLYISLEQSRKSLTYQMSKMGMDKLPEERLTVVDLGKIRRNLKVLGGKSWLEVFRMYVKNLRESTGYDILVVDSLSALELVAKLENPREELFRLFEWLRDLKTTSLLILETDPSSERIGNNGESFLVDGIIMLDMEKLDSIDVQRRIRCVKMRATNHHTGYFNLVFKDNKFQATKAITT